MEFVTTNSDENESVNILAKDPYVATEKKELESIVLNITEKSVDLLPETLQVGDYIPFIEINERLSQEWPNISEKKESLPDADRYAEEKDKLSLLKES